jgi:hypothetical protein
MAWVCLQQWLRIQASPENLGQEDPVSVRQQFIFPLALSFCFLAAADGDLRAQQTLATPKSAAATYSMKAEMVETENKVKRREATVVVTTGGIQLVDPTTAKETAKIGEGHLHYRVDDGPVIATTATKLSFHELSSGEHKISITLAGNDHKPLTDPITFIMTVP